MTDTSDETLVFIHATTTAELPAGVTVDSMAQFLRGVMKPYHDAVPDVKRGVEYAHSDAPGQGGFVRAGAARTVGPGGLQDAGGMICA